MKAGLSTGLRVAAWSASSLLVVGAVAGTADAATHHTSNAKTAKTAKTAKSAAQSKRRAADADPIAPTPTATPTAGTPRPGGGRPGGGRPGVPGGFGGPQLLHGSATVETKDGSYETYLSQTGTVSAVTATSITVVSADKFSQTYTVGDDTKVMKNGSKADASSVATGDTVMVVGEQDKDAVDAEFVLDGKPTRPTPPTGAPTAVPTASASSSAAPGRGYGGPGGFGGFGGFGGSFGPPPAGQSGVSR
ncbi:MAG TPA: hypothetical protein VG899_15720 [Mycobacteriales bacterium]|nr:hypothetical protein [Mycobacteriales bacterium]